MRSPDLSPQEVISTVLQAMKANRKFGCSIYLRFMSDKHDFRHVPLNGCAPLLLPILVV